MNFKNIQELEKRLWNAADELRANSDLTSTEYSRPVLGLIFLRYAATNKLIQVCFDNGLIPLFWQSQLTSLQNLLVSSIPTGRNKLGGHGQGNNSVQVPDYLVAYMLHMTASTLVFLINAEVNVK